LENITTFRPGEGTFYESHGFSRDDQSVLFTSDAGLSNAFGLDIFIYNLASGELVNLTNSPDEWDEHASYASHADKIAFMSSICCEGFSVEEFNFNNLAELQAEAYIMDANGANWLQLTHFNTPGYTESTDEHSVATVVSWHPDGTRLAVAQLFTGGSYDAREGRKLWVVDFNGVCQ
jgi:Tol biopolymer transport system component